MQHTESPTTSPCRNVGYLGTALGRLILAPETQQRKQLLRLFWNRPAFGRVTCQSQPGANSQVGSPHSEEAPLRDPEGPFQLKSVMIFGKMAQSKPPCSKRTVSFEASC